MRIDLRHAALLGAAVLFLSARAEAIPALARKTGMGCPACHESWPKLSDFGEQYRDRGYRVGTGDDDLFGRSLDYFPITFRTTVGYQYTSTSNQVTDQNTAEHTIGSGQFTFPGVDLIFGGSLIHHLSVFAVVTGFGDSGIANVESAWARYNDIGTSWLNLKVGKHELDLPVSEHRSYTIFTPFLIYHYHPAGSANTYSMGDNQWGAEVSGHGDGPGLRYALSVASTGSSQSALSLAAPAVYGHVTYTYLPRSRVLSRVRVGGVFDAGWWPTHFDTTTPTGGTPSTTAATGTDHQLTYHVGGEVHLGLLSPARPLSISAAWLYGREDKALFLNGDDAHNGRLQDAAFHGGFVEVDWTPLLALTLVARYDGIRNLQQSDPGTAAAATPVATGDQDGFTFGARYALWLSAYGSLAAHFEVSTVNTQNQSSLGNAVRATTVFAGADFAL
jgi:hypothetical protein